MKKTSTILLYLLIINNASLFTQSKVGLRYIIPDSDINVEEQLKTDILTSLIEFNESLVVLTSDETRGRKTTAFDLACLLFMDSKNNKIQVSNAYSDEINSYKVNVYLHRIQSLPYDQVLISWPREAIQINPNFRELSKDVFIGTAKVRQNFRSIVGGENSYADITYKRITFRIDRKMTSRNGRPRFTWSMKFTNISVLETESVR